VARTLVSSLIRSTAAWTRGAGGQDWDLLLVAGSQTAQVLAVVEQSAQIRSGADGEPDWR
jgi:hypothetical protein